MAYPAMSPKLIRDANIYLVGMMGSGKTTLGRLLAQELKRPFADLDELIELQTGRSIAQIFREEGEAGFRELETASLLEISRVRGWVVALGGGAVLRETNRRIIQTTGYSIYLKACPETVLVRLPEHPIRPLLWGMDLEERLETLRKLLAAREPYYRQADLVVPNDGSPQEALEAILRGLKRLGLTG